MYLPISVTWIVLNMINKIKTKQSLIVILRGNNCRIFVKLGTCYIAQNQDKVLIFYLSTECNIFYCLLS